MTAKRKPGRPRIHPRKQEARRCQFCHKRWAQDRNQLCRSCANALNLQSSTNYERVPDRGEAINGRVNGWPIGAHCVIRPLPVKKTITDGIGKQLVEFEVVWNGG